MTEQPNNDKQTKVSYSKSSVCLTTDTWTSIQRINYMCITAHFIDGSWTLKKES